MNQRFPRLPPLTSLRGFEAAARLGSFSRAADELHLTQSAVSHQIRVLEDYFGQPLFHRVGRSVELTDAGIDFYGTSVDMLHGLDRGSRRLAIYAKPSSVVLYASQSLAACWLTPRLYDLQQKYPNIEPWIASFHTVPELESAETHMAITTIGENEPGWVSDDLFHDAVVPLCHTDFSGDNETDTLSDFLTRRNLLHDETVSSWSEWSAKANVPIEDTLSGTNFSEPSLALDAALYKQGIALGSVILSEQDVSSKRLLPLSKSILPTHETYRLFCREDSLNISSVAHMRDWIIEQAEATKASLRRMSLYIDE